MPALPTPKAPDLTRHVAIFIADVKPLDAATQLAIAPRFAVRVRDRRAKNPIAGQLYSHRRRPTHGGPALTATAAPYFKGSILFISDLLITVSNTIKGFYLRKTRVRVFEFFA